MPEFRKLIIALAVVALFAGLASAQVGTPTGPSSSGTFTCGVTNGAVTPTLRNEGYTELTGDIVIICSGGSPLAYNTTIPTANITLFLNTQVTSRLLSTTAVPNASEALLLVDEPGSANTGYGPTVPQIPCGNANVGAGPGGCVEVVGNTTSPLGFGVPVVSPGTVVGGVPSGSPGANVFQGVVSSSQVTFYGIPVLPPSTAGDTRVFRITNVRVNANGIVAGGLTPGSVQASISINSSTSLAITNSQLTVGYVQPGLSQTSTFLRSNSSATSSTSNSSLTQCGSASVASTTSLGAGLGVLQFQENFATAFKVRQSAVPQNVPGTIYNSESGLIVGGIATTSSTTGAPAVAGLADYGTRLKATFNNVPSGVALYVSTRDVINDSNGNSTYTNAGAYTLNGGSFPYQAALVVSEAASDGGTGASLVGPATSSQTATFAVVNTGATAVPYSPVALNPVTGTGIAVWEIINTNPNQIDTVGFAVYINYSPNVIANMPSPGTMTVTLSFAPTPSGGSPGLSSSTGGVASASLPIPRFSDSLDITKNLATIVPCTTALLFPYIVNASGFDTGLAIANTTTDPFGTTAQAGTCSLYFYGSNAPPAGTGNPFVTPSVATGTSWTGLASTVAPGIGGGTGVGAYMIATCNFQDAHGFAFVSDVGARNLAMGYLPLILTRSGTSPEALNN